MKNKRTANRQTVYSVFHTILAVFISKENSTQSGNLGRLLTLVIVMQNTTQELNEHQRRYHRAKTRRAALEPCQLIIILSVV